MSIDFTKILICPETKQKLEQAPTELLSKLNQLITEKKLLNRAKLEVKQAFPQGLIRSDGKVLYPIRDGIPVMLVEESIDVTGF